MKAINVNNQALIEECTHWLIEHKKYYMAYLVADGEGNHQIKNMAKGKYLSAWEKHIECADALTSDELDQIEEFVNQISIII